MIKQLEEVDNIQEVIKNIFDVDLNISGGWGYDDKTATIIGDLTIQKEQFYHMFATMRANIELNIMLDEDNRYGGINLTLKDKVTINKDDKSYEKITFTINAINEKLYAKFIKEYKDGYGKKEFDLEDHFKRRKEATIDKEVEYWFLNK